MWLARNKNGTLCLFNDKPTINHSKTSWTVKNCDYGYPIWNGKMIARLSDVTWENSPVAVDITLSMDNFLNKEE